MFNEWVTSRSPRGQIALMFIQVFIMKAWINVYANLKHLNTTPIVQRTKYTT